MHAARAWLALGLVAGLPGGGESLNLDGCMSRSAGPERARCLEAAFTSHLAGEPQIGILAKLVEEDPAAALRLTAAAETTVQAGESPATRAKLIDLRGQALFRLERYEEAADTFRMAVALDDGTARLTWLSEGGDPVWSASMDPGEGRQERAARSFLSAGRLDGARALLAHALASGAEGWPREGWSQVGGGTVPGLDPSPSDLSARTWFPPLPDIEVKLHDGGSFQVSSARGKVLLLDFWASWCAPCLHELPRLQDLSTSEKAAGLTVLTINARESTKAAEMAARALGLTLPIGFYDAVVDRAFNVRALPTLVLADREGKIRARWDNYVPDFDGEVVAKVRSLLTDDPEGAPHKVAEVLAGGGLLEIEWIREMSGPVSGISAVAGGAGGSAIFATSGDQLLTIQRDGRIESRRRLPPAAAGQLRLTEETGEARFDLVSFRPGRKEIVWIDSRSGTTRTWSATAPALDLAVLPASPPSAPSARLVLGTMEGVSLVDPRGHEVPWKEAAGETSAVAVSRAGPSATVWALARPAELRWFDSSGRVLQRHAAPPEIRGLLLSSSGPAGVGMLPSSVRAAIVGRFLEGERAQAAIATASGQLVLVDLVTGEVRFRTRWPGIETLAAGDLDGDGREELLVGAGRTITLLSRPRRGPLGERPS